MIIIVCFCLIYVRAFQCSVRSPRKVAFTFNQGQKSNLPTIFSHCHIVVVVTVVVVVVVVVLVLVVVVVLYKGYQVSFPGGNSAGGVVLTTHPHLALRLKIE